MKLRLKLGPLYLEVGLGESREEHVKRRLTERYSGRSLADFLAAVAAQAYVHVRGNQYVTLPSHGLPVYFAMDGEGKGIDDIVTVLHMTSEALARVAPLQFVPCSPPAHAPSSCAPPIPPPPPPAPPTPSAAPALETKPFTGTLADRLRELLLRTSGSAGLYISQIHEEMPDVALTRVLAALNRLCRRGEIERTAAGSYRAVWAARGLSEEEE